jgi:hypothetical protein
MLIIILFCGFETFLFATIQNKSRAIKSLYRRYFYLDDYRKNQGIRESERHRNRPSISKAPGLLTGEGVARL